MLCLFKAKLLYIIGVRKSCLAFYYPVKVILLKMKFSVPQPGSQQPLCLGRQAFLRLPADGQVTGSEGAYPAFCSRCQAGQLFHGCHGGGQRKCLSALLRRHARPQPPGQSPSRWLAVEAFSPPRVCGLRERPGRAEAPGRADPGRFNINSFFS